MKMMVRLRSPADQLFHIQFHIPHPTSRIPHIPHPRSHTSHCLTVLLSYRLTVLNSDNQIGVNWR